MNASLTPLLLLGLFAVTFSNSAFQWMPKRGKMMAGGKTSRESSALPTMYNISDIRSRGRFQYRFTSACENVTCSPCIPVNTSAVTVTPNKGLLSTASTLVQTTATSQSVTSPQTSMDGGGIISQSTDHAIKVTAYPTAVTGISTGTPTIFNITGNSASVNTDTNKTATPAKSSSIWTSTTPYSTEYSSVATETPSITNDSSGTQFSILTPTTTFSAYFITSTIDTSSPFTRRSTITQSVISGIVSHAISTMTSPTLKTPSTLTPCRGNHPLARRTPKPHHPSAQVLQILRKTDLRPVSPLGEHLKETCSRNYQSPVILLRHHHKPKEIPRLHRKSAPLLKPDQLPPAVQPRPQTPLKPLKYCQKSKPPKNVHHPQHQQKKCHKSIEPRRKIPHKQHSVVAKPNPKEIHGSQRYEKPPITHKKSQTPPSSNDQISPCTRRHTPTQSGQQQQTSTPQQTNLSINTSHLEFTTTKSTSNTTLLKIPVSVNDKTQLTMSTTATIVPLLTMNPPFLSSSSLTIGHFSTQSVITGLVSEALSTMTNYIFSTSPPTTTCRRNYPLPAKPPKPYQPSTHVLKPLERRSQGQISPPGDHLKAACSRNYQLPAMLLRNHHKPSKIPRSHQNSAPFLKTHQHPSASQPRPQRPFPALRLCQKSKLPAKIHIPQNVPLRCHQPIDSVNKKHGIGQAKAAKSNQNEMPGYRHYKKTPITHQNPLNPPRSNHQISSCSRPHIPATTQSGHQSQTPTPQQRTPLTTINQSELTESNSTSNTTLLETPVTSLGNSPMTTTPNAPVIPFSTPHTSVNSGAQTNGNTETFPTNHITQHFSSITHTTLLPTTTVTETSTHYKVSTSGTSISGPTEAIITNMFLPTTTCLSIICPVCHLSTPDTSPSNIPSEVPIMGYSTESPLSPVSTTMNSASTFSEPTSNETISTYYTEMTTNSRSSSTAIVSSTQASTTGATSVSSSSTADHPTESLPGHDNTTTNATTISSAPSTITASPTAISPVMASQTNTTYSSPTTSDRDSTATNAITISSAPNTITASPTTMSTVMTNQTISIYSTATTSVNCGSRGIYVNGTCACESVSHYGPSCSYEEKSCKNGSYDGIQCVCYEGFYGTLCEYPAGGCLNGGYRNGSRCICTDFFTGVSCEFLTNIVSVETIDARINVVVKIDEDFNANLLNKSSNDYRIFVRDFKTVMLDVYKNVTVFKDIDIYNISKGSIVVNHSVIVALNYSLDLTQAYNDTLNQLQEAIDKAPQFKEPCDTFTSGMCFNSSFTKITSSDVPVKSRGATFIPRAFTLEPKTVIVNPVEICSGLVPGNFKNYIHNISTNWRLLCASSCYPGLVNSVNCHYGTCLVSNSGIECRCPNTDTYLFFGKNCETRLHRPSLIGGLTVATFVIILIIVAVLTFFCRRRYRLRHGSYYLREINDKSRLFRENSGVFLSAKPRPSLQEASHSNIRPTIFTDFKVYLERLETSIKMVIKRPQVVKSNYA